MSTEQAIWRLLRGPNLLMIFFSVFSMGLVLSKAQKLIPDVDGLLTYGLALAMIAGGGNALNDIVDLKSDRENKKNRNLIGRGIPLGLGWFIYVFSSVLPWLALLIFEEDFRNPENILLLCTTLLLILYSYFFQKIPVIGNLCVALLCTFPFLLALCIVFPELPWLQPSTLVHEVSTEPKLRQLASLSLFYILPAFFLTWARELVKDIEDLEGDRASGYKTLAITASLGLNKTLLQSLIVLAGTSLIVLAYSLQLFIASQLLTSLLVVLCLYPIIRSFQAAIQVKNSATAHRCSKWLKISMTIGVGTTVFFWFL